MWKFPAGKQVMVKSKTWADLYVGQVPNKESVGLYSVRQGEVKPLAYFLNGEAAREFLDFMGLAGGLQ